MPNCRELIENAECTLVYKANPTSVNGPICAEHFQTHHWADRHRDELTTRHTHEDVLSEREFEILLEACERLPEPKSYEAQLICLLAGRLGLRSGESTHFRKEWIDQDRDLIKIPQSESCDCGYCREQAKQEAANIDNLTVKHTMAGRWYPKTANSSRVIPSDVSLRVELCIDRFLDRYEEFPKSRSTIDRRVSEAADEAELTGRVYPHFLRATAASFHAYQGVPPVPLQAMMRWNDLSTAQKICEYQVRRLSKQSGTCITEFGILLRSRHSQPETAKARMYRNSGMHPTFCGLVSSRRRENVCDSLAGRGRLHHRFRFETQC